MGHHHKAALWPTNAGHVISIPGATSILVNGKKKSLQVEVYFGHTAPKCGAKYVALTGELWTKGNVDAYLDELLDFIVTKYELPRPTPPKNQPNGQVKRETVAAALSHIHPDSDYYTWLSVLMALRSTGEDWAFEMADSWSARGELYKPGEIERSWRSFNSGGIGIGTLFHLATLPHSLDGSRHGQRQRITRSRHNLRLMAKRKGRSQQNLVTISFLWRVCKLI